MAQLYQKTGSISRPIGAVTDYPCRLVVGESQFWVSQQPPAHSGTYVKATSEYYTAHFATDPAKSLTGSSYNASWESDAAATNQRFHIDLGSAIIIDKILYDNYHNSGGETDRGAKNFTFWGTNSATAFAELTYGTDTDWTQIGGALQFEQHSASGAADPKYISVTNTTAYRYYCCKIADNYGHASYMGLRRIALQKQPYDVHCNAHCKTDMQDIRFFDGSDNALDYWIDWGTLTGTTPNQRVEVWVKTAGATDGTTVKLKYGDAALDDASDGTAVFTKFKDFESGSDGDSIATADGDWTVVGGTCEIDTEKKYSGTRSLKLVGAATRPECTLPLTSGAGYALRVKCYKETASKDFQMVRHGNGTKRIVVHADSSEKFGYHDGSWHVIDTPLCPADAWFTVEIRDIDFTAGTFSIYCNDALVDNEIPMATSSADTDVWGLKTYDAAENDSWIDDLIVRKYANPEPVWGAWGEEELLYTNLLDGKVTIISHGAPSNLLDGKAIIESTLTDLLDGKAWIEFAGADLLDGAAQIIFDGMECLDGAARIQSSDINLLDGKVWIEFADTSLLDGKAFVFIQNIEVSGYYLFDDIVDLEGIFQSRLTAHIAAGGMDLQSNLYDYDDLYLIDNLYGNIEGLFSVGIELAMTDDDPLGVDPVWTDWRSFLVGDYTARAYKFRLLMSGTYPNVTPVVQSVEITIDMPDRIIGFEATVLTTGVRIVFDPPFFAIPEIGISVIDGQEGDKYTITSKDESGFNIAFTNGGSPVERVISGVAKAYGAKETAT